MHTEYEATFPDIDPDQIRQQLKTCHAHLDRPAFLQRRWVFDLPPAHAIPGGWLRLRHEGERITLTLKVIAGPTIEDQKELELEVNNVQRAEELLGLLGCQKRAYQENTRELWSLDEVAITIDTWPFLSPFVEVEGPSKQAVQDVCEHLGLLYQDALFGSIDLLYARQYGISPKVITEEIPELTFAAPNPFLRFSSTP